MKLFTLFIFQFLTYNIIYSIKFTYNFSFVMSFFIQLIIYLYSSNIYTSKRFIQYVSEQIIHWNSDYWDNSNDIIRVLWYWTFHNAWYPLIDQPTRHIWHIDLIAPKKIVLTEKLYIFWFSIYYSVIEVFWNYYETYCNCTYDYMSFSKPYEIWELIFEISYLHTWIFFHIFCL